MKNITIAGRTYCVPNWVHYGAVDADGEVCVYEFKPEPHGGEWLPINGGSRSNIDRVKYPAWDESLVELPADEAPASEPKTVVFGGQAYEVPDWASWMARDGDGSPRWFACHPGSPNPETGRWDWESTEAEPTPSEPVTEPAQEFTEEDRQLYERLLVGVTAGMATSYAAGGGFYLDSKDLTKDALDIVDATMQEYKKRMEEQR